MRLSLWLPHPSPDRDTFRVVIPVQTGIQELASNTVEVLIATLQCRHPGENRDPGTYLKCAVIAGSWIPARRNGDRRLVLLTRCGRLWTAADSHAATASL